MIKDMGYKMSGSEIAPSNKGEDKMMYPSLHLDKNIPEEILAKDVGHVCRLEIVAKIVSKSEIDNGKSVSLEIHKLGYLGKAGKKTFEEYDKLGDEEKKNYDKEQMEGEEETKEEDKE